MGTRTRSPTRDCFPGGPETHCALTRGFAALRARVLTRSIDADAGEKGLRGVSLRGDLAIEAAAASWGVIYRVASEVTLWKGDKAKRALQ